MTRGSGCCGRGGGGRLSGLCLTLLVLALLAVLAAGQRGKFVNCKKMVFAPICRGVAAKRSGTSLLHYKPQLQYMKGGVQYPATDRLSPYWIYQNRLTPEQTFP